VPKKRYDYVLKAVQVFGEFIMVANWIQRNQTDYNLELQDLAHFIKKELFRILIFSQ
jgi:hypothetical protein